MVFHESFAFCWVVRRSSVALFLPVHAADFSTVTGAFDTAGITTGIMAIGALMMAVVAVVWGLRKILGFGR